jgi:hypothetical protein
MKWRRLIDCSPYDLPHCKVQATPLLRPLGVTGEAWKWREKADGVPAAGLAEKQYTWYNLLSLAPHYPFLDPSCNTLFG